MQIWHFLFIPFTDASWPRAGPVFLSAAVAFTTKCTSWPVRTRYWHFRGYFCLFAFCCCFLSHLRGDDVEQIPRRGVLLGEDVVLVGLEGDAVHVDDEGAGRQVEGDAVLPQEALQPGGLLPQKLQGHLCAWGGGRKQLRNAWPHPSLLVLFHPPY